MINATFYTRTTLETQEIWSKCANHSGCVIHDVQITNNPKYESIVDWKHHNLGDFVKQCEFINEIYHYYYMPIIYKFARYCEMHNISKVIFTGDHKDYDIISGYFEEVNILVEGLSKSKLKNIDYYIKSIFVYLKSQIMGVGFIFIMALKWFSKSTKYSEGRFALIHSLSAYNKIKKLNEDLVYYYDSRNVKIDKLDKSIAFGEVISGSEYGSLILTSPIQIHKLYQSIKWVSRCTLGKYGSLYCANFLASRLGHFLVVKQSYKKVFKLHSGQTFYSGERESRYGALAMKLSAINGNFGVAIPHGMAYSYNYPLGLFGHKYYCCVQREMEFLQEVYGESKFIFDQRVIHRIYTSTRIFSIEKKVVFFTEPRRWKVNLQILSNLTNHLNQTIYVKLHPMDLASRYQHIPGLVFLKDFEEAISGNICLSRKSTILIEALYNNSYAIATLVDSQDNFDYYNVFPALADTRILQLTNFKQILDTINKLSY
jgi:hypothetical protein